MDAKDIINQAQKEHGKLGWKKNPFTIQPNPDFMIDFEEEAQELIFSFTNQIHSVILGDLGTGKTTVLLWLKKALQDRAHCLYFEEPPENLTKKIEKKLREKGAFGFWDNFFPVELTPEKIPRIGTPIVLLIDEIHKINEEQQEELKTLADKENVVLYLAGQDKIKEKIKKNKALKDRLVTEIQLSSLSPEAISTLIKVRIQSVGGNGFEPFNPVVVDEISQRSGGNPRKALKLCNMVLNAVMGGESLE